VKLIRNIINCGPGRFLHCAQLPLFAVSAAQIDQPESVSGNWDRRVLGSTMTATRSILMFCPQFRPITGGAERQAEKLSKALVRKGLRVKVLTPRLIANTPPHENDCGVEIHRFPLFDLGRAIPIHGIGPLNLMVARHQIMRAVWRHMGDAEVVHAHIGSAYTAFAMQAAHARGIPFLCKAVTGGARSDLRDLADSCVAGPFLARLLVRQLGCWIAITEAVRVSLLEDGVAPDRIVSIPNGVEITAACARTPLSAPPRRFLYLGRLASNIRRDVPALIRAFDRVADKFPEGELAIVGGGDLFAETAALANSARHRARIQTPGIQAPEPWLKWAQCFVFPSRFEGLSNALLEAMSYGLPCIANDIPANREVLADGRAGMLVPVEDEEALTSAMLNIAASPALAEELGSAGLRRVEEVYSIDAVAERYMQLYDTLLERSGPGQTRGKPTFRLPAQMI
jgi:glycosyltransferase involved in cell wall biosynthesis